MALSLVLEIADLTGICNTVKSGEMVIKHIAKVERVPHSRTAFNIVWYVFDETLYEERVCVGVEHADFVFECIFQ